MTSRPALADFLPRAVLLRLLVVLALVLAPHLPRLPLWEALLVPAICVWRFLVALRQWRSPNRWVRRAITLGAFAAIYASFGNFAGQLAGVGLLTVMAALKLTELNSRRDVMVMVLLMYFILVTHFLFSQELWTAAYLLLCAVLITSLLIEANHDQRALPLRLSLRLGARMVLHALPLMAVLFVLFPRIPGPLWGLPSDAGASRTGLGDDMAPGEIETLVESDEVAFRVRFDGDPPPPEEMYWRGPVLAYFTGRRWDAGNRPPDARLPAAELGEPSYRYELTLEPQRRPWLLALDLPNRGGIPTDASLSSDYQLVANADVKDRRVYTLVSHPKYLLQPELPDNQRQVFLQQPKFANPKTRALAQQWRSEGKDDEQIIAAALDMFRGKDFYYTLHPPLLGRDGVDEFLFATHRGFCEHYASAFAVLMRAAGIPTRIVTGYQGGTPNVFGDYYVIHQSDAHAWAEVWLAGHGWVRVDPTAAVAPSRVEKGIGTALEGTGDLPGYMDPSRRAFQWRAIISMRWDWVNEEWNRWVLGYGPDLQQDLLSRLGLIDFSDMILALTIAITVILGLLSLTLMRQMLPRREPDAALALWKKLTRRLAKAGFEQGAAEGPRDFCRRVAAQRPDLANELDAICGLYLQLRYLETPQPETQRRLGAAVAALRA
jgi:transglutaminase-like putative cysteine protease